MKLWRVATYCCLFIVVLCRNDCEMMNGMQKLRHKVLVLVDSSYWPLFQNWLVYINQACPNHFNNLEVACLDESISSTLMDLSIPIRCSKSFDFKMPIAKNTPNVGNLVSIVWIQRLAMVLHLIKKGYDVLLSDTDALWFRSPYPLLSQYSDSHIIASRGWFPDVLSKKWGTTLCMGFVYFRATPVASSFLRLVYEDMIISEMNFRARSIWISAPRNASIPLQPPHLSCVELLSSALCQINGEPLPIPDLRPADVNISNKEIHQADDQLSINFVLARHDIVWPIDMPESYLYTSHIATVNLLSHPGTPLKVTMLPENVVIRNCRHMKISRVDRHRLPSAKDTMEIERRSSHVNATVIHCILTAGNSSVKENYLVAYGLWKYSHRHVSDALNFIRDDWKQKTSERYKKVIEGRWKNKSNRSDWSLRYYNATRMRFNRRHHSLTSFNQSSERPASPLLV